MILYNDRLCFPEIVDYPFPLRQFSEGHLYWHTYFYLVKVVVGQFTDQPATAVKIDNAIKAGRVFCGLQVINGISEESASFVGKFIVIELIFRLAYDTDSYGLADRVHLWSSAFSAFYAKQRGDDPPFPPSAGE
jgi:hypothetical protein